MPHMGGVGGDLFMQIYQPGMLEPVAINGSGAAPLGASPESFPHGIPESGPAVSTVPGAVDGWVEANSRFGSMSLRDLLEPAIAYAEEGFPITERLAVWISAHASLLSRYGATRDIFLPDGRAPAAGDVLVQPDLARTLRAVAEGGSTAFYEDDVATEICAFLAEHGGLLTRADFAQHRSSVLEPLRTTYGGYVVYEQPPPSQGFVLLEMLNILEGCDPAHLLPNTTDAIHMMVEAKKLAFADRDECVGDEGSANAAVARLLSKEHAARQRARIDPRKAQWRAARVAATPSSRDTTYMAVGDARGHFVSYIQSLFSASKVVAGRTGIMLNDRLRGFSLEPGHPNVLAGGKRPIHTLNTFMVFRDGAPRLVGGTPGGHAQVQANLQVLHSILSHGRPPQPAIEAPRWLSGDPLTGGPTLEVALEARVPSDVVEALAARGHQVVRMPEWTPLVGSVKLIQVDPRGTLTVAGDPRRDAYVAGW
jgi:gamma-glutamyltranspeptidase/glutathione hydrolase